MQNLQFIQELRNSDLESWILVQRAYQEVAQREDIMECGFNKMSGYVYIALENGVQIASCFGQDVEYITFDYKSEEELFYDSYEEAYSNI